MRRETQREKREREMCSRAFVFVLKGLIGGVHVKQREREETKIE